MCIFHDESYLKDETNYEGRKREVLLKLEHLINLSISNSQPVLLIDSFLPGFILSSLDIGREFVTPVYFHSSQFLEEVDFSDAKFSADVSFVNATFQIKADFSKVTFQKEADFSEARFEGEAIFSDSTFQKKADFDVAAFH